MSQLSVHVSFLLSFCAYFLAAWFYLMQLRPQPSVSGAAARRLLLLAVVLQLLPFVVLGLGNFLQGKGVFFDPEITPNVALTLSLVTAFAVAIYLALEKTLKLGMIGVFFAPLSMLLMLISAVLFHFDRGAIPTRENTILLWFHIGLSILGHVAFVLAFGVSLALIVQESALKRRQFSAVERRFPSLQRLEFFNWSLLCGGLLLMGAGVVSGFVFAALVNSAPLTLAQLFAADSRVIWTLFSLLIYGALVVAMSLRRLRGSRAAWGSVIGFATSLCFFVGSSLFGSGFHVH